MEPKYEMMKKILTYTVEYADFGGEENFVKEEDVLAETFSEGDRLLASYLEGRQYHIKSVCWKKMAIGEPPNNSGLYNCFVCGGEKCSEEQKIYLCEDCRKEPTAEEIESWHIPPRR